MIKINKIIIAIIIFITFKNYNEIISDNNDIGDTILEKIYNILMYNDKFKEFNMLINEDDFANNKFSFIGESRFIEYLKDVLNYDEIKINKVINFFHTRFIDIYNEAKIIYSIDQSRAWKRNEAFLKQFTKFTSLINPFHDTYHYLRLIIECNEYISNKFPKEEDKVKYLINDDEFIKFIDENSKKLILLIKNTNDENNNLIGYKYLYKIDVNNKKLYKFINIEWVNIFKKFKKKNDEKENNKKLYGYYYQYGVFYFNFNFSNLKNIIKFKNDKELINSIKNNLKEIDIIYNYYKNLTNKIKNENEYFYSSSKLEENEIKNDLMGTIEKATNKFIMNPYNYYMQDPIKNTFYITAIASLFKASNITDIIKYKWNNWNK